MQRSVTGSCTRPKFDSRNPFSSQGGLSGRARIRRAAREATASRLCGGYSFSGSGGWTRTRRHAPGEVACDGRQRVQGGGVVAEDVAGQPRDTAVRTQVPCRSQHASGWSRAHAGPWESCMHVEAIAEPPRGAHTAIVATASASHVEAIAEPPRGAYTAIVATASARCAGGLTLSRAPHVQRYRLRPPHWLGQRGGSSDSKVGRYDMHVRPSLPLQGPHIGSARQGPGVARGARHPAFWFVRPLHARIFCGMGNGHAGVAPKVHDAARGLQLRRRYGIAQTMRAQQGTVQSPCGAAHLSERVPVASGRLHTRKSDVAPRKCFLRQKTASNPELSIVKIRNRCATYEELRNSRFPGHPMYEIDKYHHPTQNHDISNLTLVLEANARSKTHPIGLARDRSLGNSSMHWATSKSREKFSAPASSIKNYETVRISLSSSTFNQTVECVDGRRAAVGISRDIQNFELWSGQTQTAQAFVEFQCQTKVQPEVFGTILTTMLFCLKKPQFKVKNHVPT
ncbi:hypothetical protein K438DRAFT_1761581 [Mycena galopus ATCC 62051]|nr:hypothetical protein K438DRAFT_1761581 [Mycena galopus ATCC 62051]